MAGKVLVVMSSAKHLDLRDGKQYSTGFYLNEFAIPFRKLIEAGYTPVVANPNGDRPVMDAASNNAMFFGGDDALRAETLKYVEGFDILDHPKTLAEVAKEGISGYVGVFIPGGHAPVQDLSKDKNLGEILKAFHSTGKPTGILCHGPLVLLSTLADSEAFQQALADRTGAANSLAKDWPYAGYRLTVFSTGEEQYLENAGALGGFVRYYPTAALAEAGAHVDTVADWHSNVIVDRELITGQQPMSATEFGDVLLQKLGAA
jgi:putative intracellular protease/amidase